MKSTNPCSARTVGGARSPREAQIPATPAEAGDQHTEAQAAVDAIGALDDTSPDGLYRGTQGFSERALAVGLTSLGGGAQALFVEQVPVSSAEILASYTTPVELVPSPGAGKAIVLVSCAVQVIGQTVGYTIANQLAVGWGLTDVAVPLVTQLSFASDQIAFTTVPLTGFFESHDVANITDRALSLFADTMDPTGGDGDIVLSLAFYVIDIAA